MDDKASKNQPLIERHQVAVPPAFQVRSDGTYLAVTYAWNDFQDHFLIFIVLLLANPTLIAALLMLVGPRVVVVLIPMMMLAEGVLFYRAVVGMVNKVTIAAGGGYLIVRYRPLPWPGMTLGSDRIRKLYVERDRLHIVGGRKGIISSKVRQLNRPTAGIYHTYRLKAMVDDGPDVRLLGGLSSMEHGLYLEQALEKHLDIADHRGPGGMSGLASGQSKSE